MRAKILQPDHVGASEIRGGEHLCQANGVGAAVKEISGGLHPIRAEPGKRTESP